MKSNKIFKGGLWILMLGMLLWSGCSEGGTSEIAPSQDGGRNEATNGGGVSGVGGSLARFAIAKNHLFVLEDNAVRIYDLVNPSNPALVKELTVTSGSETVFAMHNYLFIGQTTGLEIINITNPANPSKISRYEHILSCDPVVANNDFAFITLSSVRAECNRGDNVLQSIDIRNISNPRLQDTEAVDFPRGLALLNDNLYVCTQGFVEHYKVSANGNLTRNSLYSVAEARDVIALDELLIVLTSNTVEQYSIGTEGQLTHLSSISTES